MLRLLETLVSYRCCFSRVRLLATPWTAAYQAPPSMPGVIARRPFLFCCFPLMIYFIFRKRRLRAENPEEGADSQPRPFNLNQSHVQYLN